MSFKGVSWKATLLLRIFIHSSIHSLIYSSPKMNQESGRHWAQKRKKKESESHPALKSVPVRSGRRLSPSPEPFWHVVFCAILWHRYSHYLHFSKEETEAWKGWGTSLSHTGSRWWARTQPRICAVQFVGAASSVCSHCQVTLPRRSESQRYFRYYVEVFQILTPLSTN